MAYDTNAALQKLNSISGFVAGAIGHGESGMAMGTTGNTADFNVDVAVAMNADVVKAKLAAARALGIEGGIDDILITLRDQYHLIRPFRKNPIVFFYIALDRSKSNLAMARFMLEDVEKNYEM